MALRYGEYRESVDIDFLVSKVDGYRHLRQRLTGADGLRAITPAGHVLNQTREVRADQYGIRTMLPHVDRFLPVHNLASLAQRADILAQRSPGR